MISTNYIKEIIDAGSLIRKMFELGEKAKRKGKHPVDFSLGNPNIGPPEEYYKALEDIIKEDKESNENPYRYCPSNSGYFQTRKIVASYMSKEHNLRFEPEHIFMTGGAANAIDILLRTLINPPEFSKVQYRLCNLIKKYEDIEVKDFTEKSRKNLLKNLKTINTGLNRENEVICIAPYFVEYGFYIKNNNGEKIVVDSDDNFDLDLNNIDNAITKRTRAIIINSPNNPTGVVYSKEKLKGLSQIIKEKNKRFKKTISVIEDAPYSKLVWDENEFNSILPYYKNTFHVNSFSKQWGIPGERIGYFAVHPKIGKDLTDREILLKALPIILRTIIVNAPGIQQRIIEKIGCDVTSDKIQYKNRIDSLAKVLRPLGFEFQMPQGGFYIWAKVPEIFQDADEFIAYSTKGEEPIFITPGRAFGREKDKKYVRFSTSSVYEKDIKRAEFILKKIIQQKANDMRR